MARPVTYYTVVPASKMAGIAAITFAKRARPAAKTSAGYKLYCLDEIKRVRVYSNKQRRRVFM